MQNVAKFEVRGNVGSINIRKKVAYISLAVADNRQNDDGKWEEATRWIEVAAFSQRARSWAEKLTKGDLVQIEGDIRPNEFERNGETEYRTTLAIERHAVLTKAPRKDD